MISEHLMNEVVVKQMKKKCLSKATITKIVFLYDSVLLTLRKNADEQKNR